MFKGLKKLFDPSYKELTRCEKIADKVIALADKYKAMSEEELKNQTNIFKERLNNGESLDDVGRRIKSFLADMFEKYKKEDKILVVTHNAFMRSLKRLFVDKDKVVEPKNLEIFVVGNDMYDKIKEKEER